MNDGNIGRILVLFSVIVFMLMLSEPDTHLVNENQSIDNPGRGNVVSSYTLSDPIIIESDSDFESQEWPGSGTQEEPYVIEGLNITSEEICIKISDTTVYVAIRNCLISSSISSSDDGIYFSNVIHGVVENCILNSHFCGLGIYGSFNCEVRNNSATNNIRGFYISSSNDCILSNNSATKNNVGFYFSGSETCKLNNNTAESLTADGFSIRNSNDCILQNNKAINNPNDGFDIRDSDNLIIVNNTVKNNLVYGINLFHSSNCSLYSNIITNNGWHGFYLWDTNDCRLSNNTIINNSNNGIFLHESTNLKISNNTLEENGFHFHSYDVSHWIHEISNTIVNGKPFGYFVNVTDTLVDCAEYGQLILVNCSSVTIVDGFFVDSSVGIELGFCNNCTLDNNSVTSNSEHGFYLWFSKNCILTNNKATKTLDQGFDISHSENCTLINNTATENSWDGFYFWNSDNCKLTNNTSAKNKVGIKLSGSNEFNLNHNMVVQNTDIGIYVWVGSENNIIILNKLGYNKNHNAWDDGTSNSWDNGEVGNFWRDYDGSGAYAIPGGAGSVDNNPIAWGSGPIMTHPQDIEYVEDTTGNIIIWSPICLNPANYTIYRNSTEIESGDWNGSDISINIDGLLVGFYNYTLVVCDLEGNCDSDMVFVWVLQNSITTTTTTTTTIIHSPLIINDIMLFVITSVSVLVIVTITVFIFKKNV